MGTRRRCVSVRCHAAKYYLGDMRIEALGTVRAVFKEFEALELGRMKE